MNLVFPFLVLDTNTHLTAFFGACQDKFFALKHILLAKRFVDV